MKQRKTAVIQCASNDVAAFLRNAIDYILEKKKIVITFPCRKL